MIRARAAGRFDEEGECMYTYKTHGTCSKAIEIEVENGVILKANFVGGCRGNTQGVARLVEGMGVDEAIRRLKGIQCQGGTSCPDQLAQALEEMKARAGA